MKVTLLTHTPEPEKIVASAAKLCYSLSNAEELFNGLTDEKASTFIRRLKSMNHETPFEMADYVFGIDGMSKACSQHFSRHRLSSQNQKSQRYVDERDFGFHVPEIIKNNKDALEAYNYSIKQSNIAYHMILSALNADESLPEEGRNKTSLENARYVLPNACETSLILKMNARELFHFFKLRCCNRALIETREIADEMLRLCKEVSPVIFEGAGAPCVSGSCPEGEMGCKNPRR